LPADSAPARRRQDARGDRPGSRGQREDSPARVPPLCFGRFIMTGTEGSALSTAMSDEGVLTGESVEAIRGHWRRGEPADALAVLASHPELWADRDAVLDLAYDEYCQRAEAGVVPNLDAFCARFPSAVRPALRDLLTTHNFLAEQPELLDARL